MAKLLEVDDQPPSLTQRKKSAYFSCMPERHGLSRKLAVASALSRGFVADRKKIMAMDRECGGMVEL